MAVVIAMLRGVNLGSYQKLNMEALRTLCSGFGLQDVQTYIQSGNVVFREDGGDFESLAGKLEEGIHHRFGFRPAVIVRTAAELRKVIANNPFADRPGVEPNRLLVVFMAGAPTRPARDQLLAVPCEPEELRIKGRELYVYYPQGMARPRIPLTRMEKMLQVSCTGRNLNTVKKLLAMAETVESAG